VTCHDAREWLSALLDEALEAHRRVEVEAHLAGCAECRSELERLGSTVGALRGLERPRAPVGFVDRVLRRVRPEPWYRRLGAWLFLPLAIKLPAGVAAVAVVAGLATLVWERTPELRSAARHDLASAPSISTGEPPQAPSPTPPAAVATARSSTPLRVRSEEPPHSPPSPTEDEAPPAPAAAKTAAPPAPEAKPDAPPAPEAKSAAPRAPEAKAAASAAPPPEAKSEGEVRAAPAPRPLTLPGSSAAQSDRIELRARSAAQSVRRTLGAAPSSDPAGRLVVRDRDAAVLAVAELLSRLGGHEIGRRRDADDTVVDLQLPAARYDEFVRGLDALGSWTPAGRPNVLSQDPPQFRMTIRLGG
jgi:hypothetical protein